MPPRRKNLMRRFILVLSLCLMFAAQAQAQNPRVWFDLEQGPVILELNASQAPITSQNFLAYVNDGFYDGIMFHRIVGNFVIQAGGFDKNFVFRSPTRPAIASERNNGLANLRGSIAMGLVGGDPNSARSQFYINTVYNDFLDADYTVFGKVVFGQSVIDELEQLRTGTRRIDNIDFGNVPMSPPLIRRAVEIQGDGFPIMPQHAGSWFDAGNPGVGFNIEIARNTLSDSGARVVLYWYDYRAGAPYWLLGVGEYEYGATEVSLDLVTWDGMTGAVDFLAPPPDESYVTVGQLNLRFADCSNGELDFQHDELGSGSIELSRLSLPEGLNCEGF